MSDSSQIEVPKAVSVSVEVLRTELQSVRTDIAAGVIALVVFASRYLTRGSIYMVDGPRLVAAIISKSYVIQPPGYWLYAHLAGVFADPAFGLAFWNQIFSGVGVGIMFLVCRRLGCVSLVCWMGALAYGSIFFLWFGGDIHSSYASQVLFPPLILYGLLLYRESPSVWRLILPCCAFSLGAGIRPSDGAFMIPFFIFYSIRWISSPRHRVILMAATTSLCLAWYLPTRAALNRAKVTTYQSQVGDIIQGRSIMLFGVERGTLLNWVRVLTPLLAAFWMFIPALWMRRRGGATQLAMLWALPGLCFFLLIYMADADYLTYCTGALILIVALLENGRKAAAMLFICFLWNTSLFLFARPVHSHAVMAQLFDFYVVKYCHYGITHRWIGTLGGNATIP